jgi:hypothetical protein
MLFTVLFVAGYLLMWYFTARFSYKVYNIDIIDRRINELSAPTCFWLSILWPLWIWPTLVAHLYHLSVASRDSTLTPIIDFFTQGPKHLHKKKLGDI